MAVFLTDGNQRATLAVVRALATAGIPVTVGETTEVSLAGSSRYCYRRVAHPCPWNDPQAFQCFLENIARREHYDLILPMTDVSVRLAARQASQCQPLEALLPFPAVDVVDGVQNKAQVLRAAQRLGISVPATFMLDPDSSLEEALDRLQFPAVVKPRYSRFWGPLGWVKGDVSYAFSGDDLRRKYAVQHAAIPFPLIQERIEGEGRGVFVLLWDSELKAAFCHRRIREKPPWGGVSVYSESMPLDSKLLAQSVALLRELQWQGPAMVEFKVDRWDGQPKLMEINGRFWGSLQLAVDAGMNFPLLLYRLMLGQNFRPQLEYRVGIRQRWLLGDIIALAQAWARSPERQLLTQSAASRLGQFLKPRRGTGYVDLRFSDLGPFLFHIREYAMRLGRRKATCKQRTSRHEAVSAGSRP